MKRSTISMLLLLAAGAAAVALTKKSTVDGGLAVRAPAGALVSDMTLVDSSRSPLVLNPKDIRFDVGAVRHAYFSNYALFDKRGSYHFSATVTIPGSQQARRECVVEVKSSSCRADITVAASGEITCHPCVFVD
jgi:hypothetical protein